MRYAIIAAGEGSRLAQEGVNVAKPLVTVGGERLTDRLFRIFMDNGAEEIYVICNEQMTAVRDHLNAIVATGTLPLKVVVKSTPSSMHSLWELCAHGIADAPFVLTTVDTVFREQEFAAYVEAFRQTVADGSADALMGVTGFVDDEKPLYVAVDGDDKRITGYYDEPGGCRHVSGGIYGLTPAVVDTLRHCIDRGEHRMRNFQRAMVADGLHLKAWMFTKVLDIDHATDIRKAEDFLKGQTR